MEPQDRTPHSGRSQSATVATFLSFVWPGLGQLYLGRHRAAAVFAAPSLVVLLVLLYLARDGLEVLVVRLIIPSSITIVVATIVAAAAWRLASMAAAFYAVRPEPIRSTQGRQAPSSIRGSSGARRVLALLALVVLVSHGLLAWGGLALRHAGSQIFVGPSPTSRPPDQPLGSDSSGATHEPTATPVPDDWINLLMVGADSGLGYNHALTDTIIVVSVNAMTQQAAMFSFPRDIAGFAMYDGGTYSGKLNSLMSYADARPREFPNGGIATLKSEVGFLLGVPIDYYAFINLAGFTTMIDVLGGVDVVNDRAINDAGYEFPDRKTGFFLTAGPHHLDGRTALAYVRSRNGPGDNDFTRARRQQQVLLALRAHMTDPAMLSKFVTVLEAVARTVQTDYPEAQAPDLLVLSKKVEGGSIDQFVLGPPYAERDPSSSSYRLILEMKKVRALSIRIFGPASAYAP